MFPVRKKTKQNKKKKKHSKNSKITEPAIFHLLFPVSLRGRRKGRGWEVSPPFSRFPPPSPVTPATQVSKFPVLFDG